MSEERLLTADEVAKWLSVAARKVLDMARDKEIIGFKVGKEWRFARHDIDAYLQANRNAPSSSPES